MHAISSYRGNRHRPPARRPPARQRQDRLQYTAPQLASAQCIVIATTDSCVSMQLQNGAVVDDLEVQKTDQLSESI